VKEENISKSIANDQLAHRVNTYQQQHSILRELLKEKIGMVGYNELIDRMQRMHGIGADVLLDTTPISSDNNQQQPSGYNNNANNNSTGGGGYQQIVANNNNNQFPKQNSNWDPNYHRKALDQLYTTE